MTMEKQYSSLTATTESKISKTVNGFEDNGGVIEIPPTAHFNYWELICGECGEGLLGIVGETIMAYCNCKASSIFMDETGDKAGIMTLMSAPGSLVMYMRYKGQKYNNDKIKVKMVG